MKGELFTTDIGNGYIVVRFSNDTNYDALFSGPWLTSYHYILVQKYNPFFDLETNDIKKMPFLDRVPLLPPYFFNKQFLSRIGNRIGKTLRVDETTLASARGQYARVSVEVDLSKPLISKFQFHCRVKKMEYEGLHVICFSCEKCRHKQDLCPNSTKKHESTN